MSTRSTPKFFIQRTTSFERPPVCSSCYGTSGLDWRRKRQRSTLTPTVVTVTLSSWKFHPEGPSSQTLHWSSNLISSVLSPSLKPRTLTSKFGLTNWNSKMTLKDRHTRTHSEKLTRHGVNGVVFYRHSNGWSNPSTFLICTIIGFVNPLTDRM